MWRAIVRLAASGLLAMFAALPAMAAACEVNCLHLAALADRAAVSPAAVADANAAPGSDTGHHHHHQPAHQHGPAAIAAGAGAAVGDAWPETAVWSPGIADCQAPVLLAAPSLASKPDAASGDAAPPIVRAAAATIAGPGASAADPRRRSAPGQPARVTVLSTVLRI